MADSYDPTIKYDNSGNETQVDMTLPYTAGSAAGDSGSGGVLQNGESIELNGKTYVIRGNLSENRMSGEAVVYKVQDPHGNILALKLYYRFSNPLDEPNNEALRRIQRIDNPDILNVYDYGTGNKKYRGESCFEICQFAPGGDLLAVDEKQFAKKYTPEFVTQEVIPQIYKGMRALHQNKIYHGDLKPHNVFYLDTKQTDLVIGDYGSAKTYSKSSHKSLAFTFMAKGTSFYLAPEQARGIMSEKNDYYSLGMVLVHLLYPQYVNQDSLVKIVERQFAKKPIIDFDPAFGRLNDLIAGLTLQEIGQRWGQREVERWMQGDDPAIAYASVAPIKLGSATLRNPSELVAYMTTHKNWYQDLIADRQGYNLLLDWITRLQDLSHKKDFEQLVNYYGRDGRTFTEVAVLRYFKPSHPVNIEGEEVDFFDGGDPAVAVKKVFSLIDRRWVTAPLEKIKKWVLDLEFCLRHLVRTAQESTRQRARLLLEKIAAGLHLPTSRVSGFHYSFHRNTRFDNVVNLLNTFLPERKFLDENGQEIATEESLGLFLARDPQRFYGERLLPDITVLAEKLKIPEFGKMSVQECLYHCLKKHITTRLRFDTMRNFSPDLDTPSRYVVTFSMTRSLTDFLGSQGLDPEIMRETRRGKKQKQHRQKQKQHKKKQFKQQEIGFTRNNLSVDLDDGNDEAVLAQFWEKFDQRYPVGGENGAPIAEENRKIFENAFLSHLKMRREERYAAEKRRTRERKRLLFKATLVVPLGLLPVVLFCLLFAGELMHIMPIKKALRSLYPIGGLSLDIRMGGIWDLLLVYLNWNLLYIVSVVPAGLLFQLWESDRRLRRPMFYSMSPPIVFMVIGVAGSLMFGFGFPLFMLLGSGIQNVPVIGTIVVFLLLLGFLKKGIFLFGDYLRASYGVSRRRRERTGRRFYSNIFKPILRCDSFRFPVGRAVPALLLGVLLSTVVLFAMVGSRGINAPALSKSLNTINKPIYTLGFSRFGAQLLAGYGDGQARVFDSQSGRLLRAIKAHRSAILSMAISSTGDRVATGSQWGFLHVWDPTDGKIVRKYRKRHYLHNGPVVALDYVSGGSILLSAGHNGLVRFWKPSSKRRYSYRYVRAYSPARMSKDVDWLVARNKYGALALWKISLPTAGGSRYRFKYKHTFVIRGARVMQAAFSPDSRFVAAAAFDGRISIWQRVTKKIEHKLRVSGVPTCLEYSSCGRYLAVGSKNGSVALFDSKSGRTIQSGYIHSGSVQAVAFSKDGRYLASGDVKGGFELLDISAAQATSKISIKDN